MSSRESGVTMAESLKTAGLLNSAHLKASLIRKKSNSKILNPKSKFIVRGVRTKLLKFNISKQNKAHDKYNRLKNIID